MWTDSLLTATKHTQDYSCLLYIKYQIPVSYTWQISSFNANLTKVYNGFPQILEVIIMKFLNFQYFKIITHNIKLSCLYNVCDV
jgi:hypothetical protein